MSMGACLDSDGSWAFVGRFAGRGEIRMRFAISNIESEYQELNLKLTGCFARESHERQPPLGAY